ncbi:YlbF family regulator [Haloplasma contractile]|uniref:YlbF family regulator n=1 Tax=Haloplasma contractile SSD-17B TaxID=1033810 RepID=U2DZN2_9MOLU|nr:YlbF family regulator [Haloplasma contractile]ERJ13662.1 hypothetical protein HLPCO_000328 [Haloplasma contractile SSD-17B]
MNNQGIEEQLDHLLALIDENEAVRRFRELEKMLNENEVIKQRIEQFKDVQKLYTVKEAKKEEEAEALKSLYEETKDNLLNIPLFNEYINLQTELNDLLQQISFILEHELEKDRV